MAQCTDGDARIEYQGNGSQKTFTFPFEYLEPTDVKVAQYDDEQLKYVNLTNGTDWRFINPTVIELTTAPTVSIVIYRCTDIDQMQATFHPGYSVKADDLNIDFNQLRLAIEEGRSGNGFLQDELQYGKELWLNRINSDDDEDGLKGDLVKSNSDLTIDDEHVASTQWIDNRYWDQCDETTYMSDNWVDDIDDVHIPTTGAVEARLASFQALSGVETVTGFMQRNRQWGPSVTNDEYVATTDALVQRFDSYVTDNNTEYPEDVFAQPGKFWVKDDENILFYRRGSGTAWIQINSKGERGDAGPQGPQGEQGDAGTDGNLCSLGDNPPTDPLVGDTWFNTTCPVGMYVWTGVQWVGTSTPGPTGPPGPEGPGGGSDLTFNAPLVETNNEVSFSWSSLTALT